MDYASSATYAIHKEEDADRKTEKHCVPKKFRRHQLLQVGLLMFSHMTTNLVISSAVDTPPFTVLKYIIKKQLIPRIQNKIQCLRHLVAVIFRINDLSLHLTPFLFRIDYAHIVSQRSHFFNHSGNSFRQSRVIIQKYLPTENFSFRWQVLF